MSPFLVSQLACLIFFSPAHALDVEGHRGARAQRPENTLPAFEYAISNGVDTIELDLAVTSDNVLVISHDPFINPEHCVDAKGQPPPPELMIHSLTAKVVQSYDCGGTRNPRFPKQQLVPHTPIPRFSDLLNLIKDSKLPAARTVRLNVETKIYPGHPDWTVAPEHFVDLVLKALKDAGMVKRTTLESFDDRTLRLAKKREAGLKTALLTSDNHFDYGAALKSAGADILSPDSDWILPEDVQALHKIGKKVLPWTVNDPQAWDRLIKMGVDGIITDDPAALIEYLKEKKLRK